MSSETGLVDVEPSVVKEWMDRGEAVLIDVREPYEFGVERIPGALLFPLATFDPKFLPAAGGKKIVLQCGTGRRSGMAGQKLLAAGATVVHHVKGGIGAWKEAELPLYAINPTTGAIEPKVYV